MIKKVNRRVYERDHIYPQSLAAYLDLLKIIPSSKYPYIAKHNDIVSFIGGYFWWARDADELERASRSWISRWLRSKKNYQQFLRKFRKSHGEACRVLPVLKNKTKNFKNYTDRQLFNIYKQAKEVLLNNLIISEYSVDVFDDYFNQIFTEQLGRISKRRINSTDRQELLRPVNPSVTFLYHKRLLELSLNKKVTLNTFISTADRFSWVVMSWDGSNELTPDRARREVRALRRKSVLQRKQELADMKEYKQSVKSQRLKIVERYNLPLNKLAPYFHLLDTFTVLHDWRKEAQMRCCQVIFGTLREMSRRFTVRYSDLLLYLNPEIERLCLQSRKVAQTVMSRRQTGLTWVIRGNKISQYQGREAKKKLEELVLSVQKAKQVSRVNGIPVSPGQVRGKVLVAKSAKKAVRVLKSGGILVTSMTTVDYLPAMRRATAIVTDDGGVTCHAAIVSRELGVPCVVGTKIATQVLKDGDRIEVDANKGIITKL